MASTPWFCGWCRKTVKGSFTNCPWCGSHWQNSATGTPRRQTPYPPSTSPRRRQKQGHVQRGYGSYGDSEDVSEGPWNYHGHTKSPRRQPRKSPARPNNAKQKAKKNHGNRVPQAEPSWEPDHPKASANSSAPSTAAEQHLKELVSAVTQMEHPLTADVQKALTNAQKLAAVDPTKQLQSAASRLRTARDQLAQAREARLKMHGSWAKFITEAVQRWNQHIEDFETRDAEHQSAIQVAMEKYQNAKQEVESSKEALTASEITLDINAEVNDEELMADDTPSIQDDMKAMVTNLDRIRARQAEALEESATKKPRVEKEEEPNVRLLGAKSLQPFGGGGR